MDPALEKGEEDLPQLSTWLEESIALALVVRGYFGLLGEVSDLVNLVTANDQIPM